VADPPIANHAVSLRLIVAEGVLNALKHAFPEDKRDGRIVIAYEVNGSDWLRAGLSRREQL
jgi:chemotaxis protein methyltransferase CheR